MCLETHCEGSEENGGGSGCAKASARAYRAVVLVPCVVRWDARLRLTVEWSEVGSDVKDGDG